MKVNSSTSKAIDMVLKAATLIIILMGVGVRIAVYLQNRNLFIDEANLARNVFERDMVDLAAPLSYEQYAPPVFLWVTKLFTSIFGYGELAFRIFPLLAGIAALYLMYLVLKELTSFKSLWYPLGMLAISYIMIRYSSELKQYMTDVLVVLSLILLAIKTDINKVNGQKFVLTWFIAGSIAIWAAMPSIFVLAGIGLYYLVIGLKQREYKKFPYIAVVGALWLLQFLIYYSLILQPQIESEYLQRFHTDWFLFLTPSNADELKHNVNVLRNLLEEAGGYNYWMRLFNAALLFFGAVWFSIKDARSLMLTVPLIGVMIAAGLNQYTLIPRVALFTMPLMLILIGYGMEQLMRLRFVAVPIIVALIGAWGIWAHSMVNMAWNPTETEQVTDAMEFAVKNNITRGEQLYLHNGARPAFIYYTQMHPGRAKWKNIAGAHLLMWDADYDQLASTAPTPSAVIFTSVSPDELAKTRATVEKYNTQIAAFEKQGCHVFIYKK